MKKFKMIAPILLAVVLLLGFSQCHRNKEKLEQIAKATNMLTPIPMDQGLVLMDVEVLSASQLQFNFLASKMKAEDVTQDTRDVVERGLISMLADAADAKLFKEMKTTLIYSIKNAEEEELMRIELPYEKYSNQRSKSEYSAQELTQELVSVIEPQLPITVDEYTVLKDVQSIAPDALEYTYELKKEVDESMQKEFAKAMTNLVKQSPELQYMRNKSVTFRYIYQDTDGEEVFRVEIEPKDYQ